jgi:hypothetical protein
MILRTKPEPLTLAVSIGLVTAVRTTSAELIAQRAGVSVQTLGRALAGKPITRAAANALKSVAEHAPTGPKSAA